MLTMRHDNGYTLPRSAVYVKTPAVSYRLTHVSLTTETCRSVTKGLFRALLTQLHPGGYGILAHKAGGGKTSAGDLSTVADRIRTGKGSEFAGRIYEEI